MRFDGVITGGDLLAPSFSANSLRQRRVKRRSIANSRIDRACPLSRQFRLT